MNNTIGPATVRPKGGLSIQNEVHNLAKITLFSDIAKLYRYYPETKRFEEVDRLTGAEVTFSEVDPTKFTVTGVSDNYLAVGDFTNPTDPEAKVTWEGRITGSCSDCG